MSLEEALEFIADDELVEVTPTQIRLRKIILKEVDRRRAERSGVQSAAARGRASCVGHLGICLRRACRFARPPSPPCSRSARLRNGEFDISCPLRFTMP